MLLGSEVGTWEGELIKFWVLFPTPTNYTVSIHVELLRFTYTEYFIAFSNYYNKLFF